MKTLLELLKTEVVEMIFASIILPTAIWVGIQIKNWRAEYIKGKKFIKKNEDEIHYLNSLRSVADGYSAMQRLEDHPLIERVFLLEISNGGSRPKVGSKVYANAVEIKIDRTKTALSREEIISRYDRIEIDENYIYMVIEAKNNGVYKFKTDSERSGLLKNLYVNEGIKYSEIYHIHTDSKNDKMFILSISTHKDEEEFKDETLTALIVSEVSTIKSAFKNYRG